MCGKILRLSFVFLVFAISISFGDRMTGEKAIAQKKEIVLSGLKHQYFSGLDVVVVGFCRFFFFVPGMRSYQSRIAGGENFLDSLSRPDDA